jgi:hypothetical protein
MKADFEREEKISQIQLLFIQYSTLTAVRSMFQYSRRTFASLEQSQSEQSHSNSSETSLDATSTAPIWAKNTYNDSKSVVAQINLASACPYCVNYNLGTHHCDLYGEPIPQREDVANPCKGNTFNRKQYSGNRLAQLRALRGNT